MSMEMGMETEGPQPTGGRFESRIDNLLSSALQDQAREQRMLFEIVQGARAALAKAEQELGALRILIERRDQSVVDLLEARLSGVGTEQGLEQVARTVEQIESKIGGLSLTQIETQLSALEGAVGEIPSSLSEQMTSDLASRQTAAAATSRQITQLGESLTGISAEVEAQMTAHLESERQARAALSRQIEDIRAAVAAQSSETVSSIAEAIEPFTANLEALSERIRQSNRRITESNSRLQAMHESILDYLTTRDERLEESRDRILADLVAQMTQDLSRRDRIRITTAFKEAEQHRKDQRDATRYRRLKKPKAPSRSEPI